MARTAQGAMPPPPSRSKALGKRKASEIEQKLPLSINRQRVLDEDDYANAVSTIIKRDFFPELHQLDLEKERMKRLRTAQGMLDASGHDATSRTSRYGTPIIHSAASVDAGKEKEKAFDDSLSLSAFLERYTSEDNASFASILDRDNEARAKKHKWAFEAETKANDREKRLRLAREALVSGIQAAIEASELGEVNLIEGLEAGRPGGRLVLESGRMSILGDRASVQQAKLRQIGAASDSYKLITGPAAESGASPAKSVGLHAPSAGAGSMDSAMDTDAAQSSAVFDDDGKLETWSHSARNTLFFAPDANDRLRARLKPLYEELSVAAKLGIGDPKSIVYGNTRLASGIALEPGTPIPPSPSTSNIAAAIAGQPYHGRESMTPRVGGYEFVSSMPSPSPSDVGDAGLRRLMTRGHLRAAPVALNARDAEERDKPASIKRRAYDMPDTPRRELLAHKMASDASKSLQARHSVKIDLPRLRPRRSHDFDRHRYTMETDPQTPRASDEMLSPAAKTLLDRTGGRIPALRPTWG